MITPAFNSSRTLGRAIGSALAQTLRDLELLIVDDGSADDTLAVARALERSDARVRVIALPCNRGKPYAMNLAMAEAAGRWIAVLDADDWYDVQRLEKLIATGEAQDVDLVADNQFFFDDGANRIVRPALPPGGADRRLTRKVFAAGCDPYAEFDFGMLKPVVRADFVRRTGLRYRESARLSEDFFFLTEFLAAGGQALLVAEPLYYWRQAFGSLSRRWTDTGAGSWRYDFASALAANNELLHELRSRREPILARLLTARGRAFRRLVWLNEANRLRAEAAPRAAVWRAVLRHPSIWPEIARRAWRAVCRRLGVRTPMRQQLTGASDSALSQP